jgi:hypothetical protein
LPQSVLYVAVEHDFRMLPVVADSTMGQMRCVVALVLVVAGCSTPSSPPRTDPNAGAGPVTAPSFAGQADPDDPRLRPEAALEGALEEPSAAELWRYLLRYTETALSPESHCDGRQTLGDVLASHLGVHEARRFFEIGCGRPGDERFEAPDRPPCPSLDTGEPSCLPCVMLMWVDDVTEDPALFLVGGHLHFQYREGAPLEPSSVFCLEAG